MDNHLWEHEDIVVAKLIVCLEHASPACDRHRSSSCWAWLHGANTNRVLWLESMLRFVLCMYKLLTASWIFCALTCCLYFLTQISNHSCTWAHTNVYWCMQMHLLTPTPFKCCPSQTDLALLWFELTLFPVQMTASTWEMSGSLCQLCLASSNICEVLSSSLQLRRAVSQDSRLLTHKAAKTAMPSVLKHIHFVHSFASTKDCIPSKFVVFKAALSPCCEGSCITY